LKLGRNAPRGGSDIGSIPRWCISPRLNAPYPVCSDGLVQPNPAQSVLASTHPTGDHPAHAQGLQLERFPLSLLLGRGNPREPIRIHAERGEADCKFWLYPAIRLAYDLGFNARELRLLTEVIEARRSDIERAWNEHFS
jgi:hypothetical protein